MSKCPMAEASKTSENNFKNIARSQTEMFGTGGWSGIIDEHPALVLTFYGGQHLYVFRGGDWEKIRITDEELKQIQKENQ